jgi:hypothetical protein
MFNMDWLLSDLDSLVESEETWHACKDLLTNTRIIIGHTDSDHGLL